MQITKDGDLFNTTTQIKDSSGNKVSVPGGFKVTQDSGNNVSEGIVIEDVKGNQFVWIPVNSTSDFQQNLSYPILERPAGYECTEIWDPDDSYPNGIYDINGLIEIGGFYVSRFWIVKEGGEYISKKGKNLGRNFYENRGQLVPGLKNNFINTRYAKSSLISGVAYDSLMRFLHGKRVGNGNTVFNENAIRVADGDVTGESSAGPVCNVFDIAPSLGYGILTTEMANAKNMRGYQVFRGRRGVYYYGEELRCPSFRGLSPGSALAETYHVRAALYVFN